MPEYFISPADAENDLLLCAAFISERISSGDGRSESVAAVVPELLRRRNVDLAAELANTLDDPFTRDKLLGQVAEKCAEIDDEEYAMQLAEAIDDLGLRSGAIERIALQLASKGKFDKAREIAETLPDPDPVYGAIAFRQSEQGSDQEAAETLELIEVPGPAAAALEEMAAAKIRASDADAAALFLGQAADRAADIEHTEEKIRTFLGIGNLFLEAGRRDRAVETIEKARLVAEALDNVHRDGFLASAALGFLHAGSLELAERALDLVKDKTQMATCLLGYARHFWGNDEREEAIDALEESYEILRSQHERETRSSPAKFALHAAIAAQFAGFEKGERAIGVAQEIEEETNRLEALTEIAGILALQKSDELAESALRAIEHDAGRVYAYLQMAASDEKNGDQARAIARINEASILVETIPQLPLRAAAFRDVGSMFYRLGEPEKAAAAFGESLATIASIRDDGIRAAELTKLAAIYDAGAIELTDADRELVRPLISRAMR